MLRTSFTTINYDFICISTQTRCSSIETARLQINMNVDRNSLRYQSVHYVGFMCHVSGPLTKLCWKTHASISRHPSLRFEPFSSCLAAPYVPRPQSQPSYCTADSERFQILREQNLSDDNPRLFFSLSFNISEASSSINMSRIFSFKNFKTPIKYIDVLRRMTQLAHVLSSCSITFQSISHGKDLSKLRFISSDISGIVVVQVIQCRSWPFYYSPLNRPRFVHRYGFTYRSTQKYSFGWKIRAEGSRNLNLSVTPLWNPNSSIHC